MKHIAIILLVMVLSIFSIYSHAFTYIAPTNFDNPTQWYKFENTLLIDPSSTISIYIDGDGGREDVMINFIKNIEIIRNRGQKIEFIVNSHAISASAVSALCGDRLILKNYAFLYLHCGFGLDGHNNRIYDKPIDKPAIIAADIFRMAKYLGITITNKDLYEIFVNHKAVEFEQTPRGLIKSTFVQIPSKGNPWAEPLE